MDRFPERGTDGILKLHRCHCVVVSFKEPVTSNTCMTFYLRGTVSMHCNVLRFQSRSERSLIYGYTTMCARGLLGGRPVHFLIDSGAAVSVICHDILSTSARTNITKAAPLTVGANGLPLDVLCSAGESSG